MGVYRKLPVLNVIRKPVRSAVLICLTAFLSFALFAGIVLTSGLQNGVHSLERRLGADLMVVPEEAAGKSGLESIVLQGSTGYFYMPDTVLDSVTQAEGVEEATSQLFLASLTASCCSAKVQLIGFDPQTDFSIFPWIRGSLGKDLEKMDIVVGADIASNEGDRLLFYDTPCRVAAKLEATGTNYDRCVFAGQDTVRELTSSSVGKHLNQFQDIDPNHVLSCILVNVKEGADPDAVANAIRESADGVEVVRTRSMIADVSDSLAGTARLIAGLILAVCLLVFVILVIAFSMQVNERRREFAILRVCGVTRRQLVFCIGKELLVLCAAGGILGGALAVLMTGAFRQALQGAMGLPMLLPGAGAQVLCLLLCVAVAAAAGILAAFRSVRKACAAQISLSLRQEK